MIEKVFSKITEKEVTRWVKRNIPQTLLSRKSVVMRDKKDNVFKISEFKQTLQRGRLSPDNWAENWSVFFSPKQPKCDTLGLTPGSVMGVRQDHSQKSSSLYEGAISVRISIVHYLSRVILS